MTWRDSHGFSQAFTRFASARCGETEEPLVAAIWAEPSDDAPILVLADWLDERSRPEADYLRMMVAAAGAEVEDDRRRELLDWEKKFRAEIAAHFRDVGRTTAIYHVRGPQLWDSECVHKFREEIFEFLDSTPASSVIIDLRNTEHMSGAARCTLLLVWRRMRARRGRLALANVSRSAAEVFRITQLDRVLMAHGDLADSLAAVNPTRT